jgi:hypothetical protein
MLLMVHHHHHAKLFSIGIEILVAIYRLFFTTLTVRLTQKIVQVPSILFAKYFIIVGILSVILFLRCNNF